VLVPTVVVVLPADAGVFRVSRRPPRRRGGDPNYEVQLNIFFD
jgi:hypothetical protein